MSRLSTIKPSDATGVSAEIFGALKRTAGMIPNSYLTLGTHSPVGLRAVLGLDEVVETGSLSRGETQAIRLVVSADARCEYGIAAHSFLAKFSGVSDITIANIKAGLPTGNAKLDTLIGFVRRIVNSKGTLESEALTSVLKEGYTEQHIIEVTLAIASTSLINMINRVNDTAIDFPTCK